MIKNLKTLPQVSETTARATVAYLFLETLQFFSSLRANSTAVWHAVCNKNSSLIWALCNLYGPHVTYMDPI